MRFRAFVVLSLAIAACGGAAAGSDEGVASIGDSSTTTAVGEEADPEEAAIAFTECMRENGVEMEDPTVDADGNVIPGRPTDLPEPDEDGNVEVGPGELGEDLGVAFEECGDLLDGTAFGFTPEDQTELEDQLLALAQCLRDQGLDVADPDLSGGPDIQADESGDGLRATGPFGIDFQDPEVQAALEQCQEFVPNFQGGPGGGGSSFNVAPPGGDNSTQSGSSDD